MLIQIHEDRIEPIPETTFRDAALRERSDLQRLLKANIQVLGEPLLVIAEEFGDFEDSGRRIDLLALDPRGNLVVIELKRDKGAHMDLQAVRYAAMVSTMRFDQAVSAYERFLAREGIARDARDAILNFLDPNVSAEEPALGDDVRIILVSENFSKELTTAVLWLAEHEIDIRCVRVKAYRFGEKLLADVAQVLPLPETEEYMVRVAEKRREQRAAERGAGSMEEFWARLEPTAREPMRVLVDWLEHRASYLYAGRACVPVWIIGSQKHYLCRLRRDGQVAVCFDYLSRKEPFSSRERREELRARLNEVPGVALPEDRLDGRPRFDVRILSDPAVAAKLFDVIGWWTEQLAHGADAGVTGD